MITLEGNSELVFSFPEVHKDAELRIAFKRTLRIPDDSKTYFLPPGLDRFPLQHVDDHAASVSSRSSSDDVGTVSLPALVDQRMTRDSTSAQTGLRGLSPDTFASLRWGQGLRYWEEVIEILHGRTH